MSRHPCRSIATTALLCPLAPSVFASANRDLSSDLGGSPDPAGQVLQIDAQSRIAFDAALREYDARIAEAPFDVAGQLRRCRFIDVFIANHEFASFVEE